MNKQIMKPLIWGFLLWLFGYVLGIVFFFFVPASFLGWAIMPFGILFTIWVLQKKIWANSLFDYIIISVIWTLLAIILDYFLLVQLFKPFDGYYKLDVYVYYILTFLLPLIFYFQKKEKIK